MVVTCSSEPLSIYGSKIYALRDQRKLIIPVASIFNCTIEELDVAVASFFFQFSLRTVAFASSFCYCQIATVL
jgi:hypothetical protein